MDAFKKEKAELEKVEVHTNDHLPLKATYSLKKTLVLC